MKKPKVKFWVTHETCYGTAFDDGWVSEAEARRVQLKYEREGWGRHDVRRVELLPRRKP